VGGGRAVGRGGGARELLVRGRVGWGGEVWKGCGWWVGVAGGGAGGKGGRAVGDWSLGGGVD